MKWFEQYSSNTLASSGNQYYFITSEEEVNRGRIYYKIFSNGFYDYSLLFSNIIDSTYAEGKTSHCNLICDEWEILSLSLGVCKTCDMFYAPEPEKSYQLLFNGKVNKSVMPGEFFVTDPIAIHIKKGEYLCVEIVFKGRMIPTHEESILPAFVLKDGQWIPSKQVPFPSMIGCNREVKKKIGFWGDSITQGIGTTPNDYMHWNALAAEEIGDAYSYWNLGLGYGRAQDAASSGAWLYKAKQMDIVVLCFGINDIAQGRTLKQIEDDLLQIIKSLKVAGVRVMIQTLPPFDFVGEYLECWRDLNSYIRTTLSSYADEVFDVVPILIDGNKHDGKSKYGAHPNEQGCRIWARELAPILKKF